MSAIQQMLAAGRSLITVTGSLSGAGSLSIPAGVTSVSLTGAGGTGTTTWNAGTPDYCRYTFNYASLLYWDAVYSYSAYGVPKHGSSVDMYDVGGTYTSPSYYALSYGGTPASAGNVPLVVDVYSKYSVLTPGTSGYYSYTTGASTTATLNGVTDTWAGGYGGAASSYGQTLASNGSGQTMTYSIGPGGSLSYSYTY